MKDEVIFRAKSKEGRANAKEANKAIFEDFSYNVRRKRRQLGELMARCYKEYELRARLNFNKLVVEGGRIYEVTNGVIKQTAGDRVEGLHL